MKSTIRINEKNPQKTAELQPQKQDKAVQFQAMPLHASARRRSQMRQPGTVTILFRDEKTGRELDRVEFPEWLYSEIKRASRKLGITVNNFFREAIAGAIEGANVPPLPKNVAKGGVK